MSKPALFTTSLIALWTLAVGWGFLLLGAYHFTPSGRGAPPDRWPSDAPIPLDKSLPTLLIFIHPRCPCSLASLAELEELSARCRGRFAAHIVTFRPDVPAGGSDGPGWKAEIDPTGPSRWADLGGREARRFGVESSGHVLLFDPSGRRLFSGGITLSRGHRGTNPGLDRLIGVIVGELDDPGSSPVFGCPVLATGPDRSGGPLP